MMRKVTCFACAALILAGCSSMGTLGLVTKSGSDPGALLRNAQPYTEIGPASGSSCRFFLLAIAPWGNGAFTDALDQALAKSGGDALINVAVQNSLYGLIPIYNVLTWQCTDIQGTAIKFEPLAPANAMETQGVCYRAHVQNVGWQAKVCNDSMAGTTGQGLRLEAIQIWSSWPGLSLCYQAQVQNIGWQAEVCNGGTAGTVGQGLTIEAIKIRVASTESRASVFYRAHIQNLGWQGEVSDGQVAGTTGQGLRMEALTVRIASETPPRQP